MDDATQFTSDEDDASDFELSEVGATQDVELIGVLGEYLLLEKIGAGGMGQVYRAEHRTMNREVALKILSKQIANRRDLLEQFFSEIRAVARLMHPNIVTAFDAGSVGNAHYLVMELVSGDVVSSHVRRHGPLSTADAVSVLAQSARALAYAHKQGIVHRDIKPNNMMLTQDGAVKILDFGLAHFSSSETTDRSSNLLIGTPEYMSPEQIESPGHVDGRSDLYSLGATLYYLLTGKPMFTGDKMQVTRAQLHQKPTPLFVARSGVDLRLDAVFQKLVAKHANERYANAEELLESLQNLNLTSQSSVSEPFQKSSFRLTSESPTSVAFDKSTLAKKSKIVAIDLGMLSTTTAYYDAELGPQIIPQGENGAQALRNMLWSSGEQIKIGADAASLRQSDPSNVFHSPQRWIGASQVSREFGGRKVPPEILIAAVLRQVMHNASALSDSSTSAIVTVPGCYDQMHRRAIRNACRIAGIELIQLLDKPLAAALSWLDVQCRLSLTKGANTGQANTKLLVVHLGGTGLEASVIQTQGTMAQQLGVSGHWKLGKQRWQNLLTEYFATTLLERTGKSVREDVVAATRLQRTLELAMERLTRANKVDIRFEWLNASLQQTVTQEGLVKIAPALNTAIHQSITNACAIAKTDLSEIDQILLTGSMMHMKSVQKLVKDVLPHSAPIRVLEKSDFARGAAIQASHNSSLTLKGSLAPSATGCAAYSIGLLAESLTDNSHKPRVLLEKGTATPASLTRTLRPRMSDGTPSFPTLQLIESSSLGDQNWNRLGKIRPAELFSEMAPDEPLLLRMEIDENGILESSLLWPSGEQQLRIPASADPEINEQQLISWRDWLETTMLCADS